MADSDYAEFSIAHDRLYTLDHLWMQVLDEDKDEGTTSIKIGLSEFLMAEFGEVIQVVLARPRDCLLYTSPSPRDLSTSRMPSSA